jgi:hypothetical protein
MSGYPLKSVYDATKKRQKYIQELALRAKLDDVNLQANKLYKRTGVISALPDNRTTTEKLADLYRLRIEIFSKLSPVMSGDEAQKVVNGLDANEIRFLSQRLDKIIQYLKPKYKLGIPYQVFNNYLQKSIEAMNTLGDDNIANLVLVENMVSKDDFNSALTTMMQQYSTAEQNKLRGAMRMYEGLTNTIKKAQQIVNFQNIDPQSQNDLTRLISDMSSKMPTDNEIENLDSDYQTAISYSDTQAIANLKQKIDTLVANVNSLQNDKQDLEQSLNDAIRSNQISQVQYTLNVPLEQQTISQIPSQIIYKTLGPYTYIPPNDIMDKQKWPRFSNSKIDLFGYLTETEKLLPDKQLWKNRGGVAIKTMGTNWLVDKLRRWIIDNDDLFKEIWTETTISAIPSILPTPQVTPQVTPYQSIQPSRQQSLQPSAQQSLQPSPQQSGISTPELQFPKPVSQLPKSLTFKLISDSIGITPKNINDLISDVVSELSSAGIQISSSDVKQMIKDLPSTQTYQTSIKSLPEISAYILDWINNLRSEPNISVSDYIDNRVISGSGMKKKSKQSGKMKGKGISIDFDAGMQSGNERQSNYVPFGKFIINRKKLADGIIMIKRSNGAFMGDMQTKRISSKLKNVFDKIVGGNIPSFNDYDKLDDDEREYLKYVSSKSNLEDKLSVPAPKKDTDEQLINKFDVMRGQLCAGQDNREMIEEFKKILIELCDKKLLPRRQVSDILIDLARYY